MRVLAIPATILLWGCAATAYEEPAYEVVAEREGYEIRRYAPYVVAETVVQADFDGAGNEAFRRLYGYISGKNRQAGSGPGGEPEKIKMTIPVVTTTASAQAGDTASYTYYFVMPSSYTLETLPRPDDARITLRQLPAHVVAVRRYSGRSNEANYRHNERLLLDALNKDAVQLAGEPLFAVYNWPFTPWFLRRNEVMITIADVRPATREISDSELAPCPSSPNCVSSDASEGAHHVPPFTLAGPPDEVWGAVQEVLSELPRTRIVKATSDYLHAECRSALFRFVDDLELQLRPAQGVIAVRSASRLGYSDLGVNRRRVEALRAALTDRGALR
jgi:uncharacterized protein (DUF1499 family)